MAIKGVPPYVRAAERRKKAALAAYKRAEKAYMNAQAAEGRALAKWKPDRYG
ncbi:MAG: hypothetical protein R6U93_00860 [Dehalococcoidia bacterium]